MIGKFWDVLFDYADRVKAEGNKIKYEAVHEIEDLLQKTYDDGIKSSNVIKNRTPKGGVERLVLSIPDIMVYKDKQDGQVWYELEAFTEHGCKRFDTPEEVIKAIIDYRTNKLNASMGEEKDLMLVYISKRLREIRNVEEVLKKNGEKKVMEVE